MHVLSYVVDNTVPTLIVHSPNLCTAFWTCALGHIVHATGKCCRHLFFSLRIFYRGFVGFMYCSLENLGGTSYGKEGKEVKEGKEGKEVKEVKEGKEGKEDKVC